MRTKFLNSDEWAVFAQGKEEDGGMFSVIVYGPCDTAHECLNRVTDDYKHIESIYRSDGKAVEDVTDEIADAWHSDHDEPLEDMMKIAPRFFDMDSFEERYAEDEVYYANERREQRSGYY